MQCMKCGREIEAGQVFCGDCLADMENYPVKPGTVVQLPPRPVHHPAKKQLNLRHHPVSPEEQVRKLKKWVMGLTCALALSVAMVVGLICLLVNQQLEKEDQALPGQNYSSATTTEPDAAN